MNPRGSAFRRRLRGCLTAVALGLCMALPVWAAQLKLDVKLIWATDDEKYSKHEKVDPATTEKLRQVFRWKHYFIIKKTQGIVPSRGTNSFKMSDKCTIEITELEGPRVAVKLIGDGKPVNKVTKDVSPGGSFTIGGDAKDGTGWFVLIKDLEETSPTDKK
jgi:hypothetical protein